MSSEEVINTLYSQILYLEKHLANEDQALTFLFSSNLFKGRCPCSLTLTKLFLKCHG